MAAEEAGEFVKSLDARFTGGSLRFARLVVEAVHVNQFAACFASRGRVLPAKDMRAETGSQFRARNEPAIRGLKSAREAVSCWKEPPAGRFA